MFTNSIHPLGRQHEPAMFTQTEPKPTKHSKRSWIGSDRQQEIAVDKRPAFISTPAAAPATAAAGWQTVVQPVLLPLSLASWLYWELSFTGFVQLRLSP